MKFVINKMMIQKVLLSVFVTISATMQSQTLEEIKFNEIAHDFGKINEQSDEVMHLFQFKNVSKNNVFITKVETSCGCTTPEWIKDTIKPGAFGWVKAFYNTEGKSGEFQKYLYVHINRPDYFTTLIIRGSVIPRPKPDYEKSKFKLEYGNLAFSENMANFGVVMNTEVKEKVIHVFNYNDYPIHILSIDEKPDFADAILKDSVIEAGDSIDIILRVTGNKMIDIGDSYNRIAFETDDPAFPIKNLYVMTRLKEDFSKLTKKELKNAPKLKLSKGPTIELGKHAVGSKFTEKVIITNTGKTDLIIRKVTPNCSCIKVNKSSFVIKPGATFELIFTYDTINQIVAEHSKHVSLICNDPSSPEINFTFLINITN